MCTWRKNIKVNRVKMSSIEKLQTPPAGIANAARGNAHRRTRSLPSPHAAFGTPANEAFKRPYCPFRMRAETKRYN